MCNHSSAEGVVSSTTDETTEPEKHTLRDNADGTGEYLNAPACEAVSHFLWLHLIAQSLERARLQALSLLSKVK